MNAPGATLELQKSLTDALAKQGVRFLRTEWPEWSDKVRVVVDAKAADPVTAQAAAVVLGAAVELTAGTELQETSGRLSSMGGMKAGLRIGITGAFDCTSNLVVRDLTNSRWAQLTAGHCLNGLGASAHTVTHDGAVVGNYRVNSAVNAPDGAGKLQDVALVDLNPGQQNGPGMWVGTPIDSNASARGHAYLYYAGTWTSPTSGQMVCAEGAALIRNEPPYVNAGAYRGAMQTVCGSEDGATGDGLVKIHYWGNGFAAGAGWGEVTCAGDSGGQARVPGTEYTVGILSRSPTDRPDLVNGPSTSRFCGSSGYFYKIQDAFAYYASQGITLQAEDHLGIVKSIVNRGQLACLNRDGGAHYPGLDIVGDVCPQDWRMLPMSKTVWDGGVPVGDDIYMIEHWGVCLNVNTAVTPHDVNQGGCPGGPASWPNATEMQWRLTATAEGAFQMRSEADAQWLFGPNLISMTNSNVSNDAQWTVG